MGRSNRLPRSIGQPMRGWSASSWKGPITLLKGLNVLKLQPSLPSISFHDVRDAWDFGL